MVQKIKNFDEKFASVPRIATISKDMNFFEKKKMLADSFGTQKSRSKIASAMLNKVQD